MVEELPAVSVVVPVFQSERYVADTLRSVLAQTLTDFEVIVVDDGSPDRSLAICRGFSDPRIRYVHQANGGLAAARNAGIRVAGAPYVAFLDSDDLWEPEKLAHHVAHLDARPDVGVSYSFSAFVDEEGRRLGSYQMLGKQVTVARDCFVLNPIGNGSNAVVRAAVLRGERRLPGAPREPADCLFDEELRQAEDYELWVRIALQTSWRIACTPWPLTLYRLHTAGLSSDTARQRAYHLRAIEKIAVYAPGLVDRHRSRAESNLHWYLARNLLVQGRAPEARREMATALRKSPANLRLYHALLVAYLALAGMLPPAAHGRLMRAGQRIYGCCQLWLIRRRQRRARGGAGR